MYFFSIDICAIINERIICQFSKTSFTPKISKITRKFGNKIARANLHTAELGGSSHATLCTNSLTLIYCKKKKFYKSIFFSNQFSISYN